MNKCFPLITICFALLMLISACTSVASQTQPQIQAPEPPVAEQKSPYSLSYLCNHPHKIENVPYDPSLKGDDPIYNGLMAKGRAAMPCLIEKITDTTPMPDPRSAPAIADFRVGDLASARPPVARPVHVKNLSCQNDLCHY